MYVTNHNIEKLTIICELLYIIMAGSYFVPKILSPASPSPGRM